MSNTISIRLKHLSTQKARHARYHAQRIGFQPNYVNTRDSDLNSIMISAPTESILKNECIKLRNLQSKKRNFKSDAAIITDGLISFGKAAQKIINALTIEEQDDVYYRVALSISEFLNSKLVSLVAHRDESAPHAHFGLLSIDQNGIPNSKKLTPEMMSKIQDLAGEEVDYLDIQRGKKKIHRIEEGEPRHKWINRSVKTLHEELQTDIENKYQEMMNYLQINEALSEKNENLEMDIIEANDRLVALNEQVEQLQRRLNILSMALNDDSSATINHTDNIHSLIVFDQEIDLNELNESNLAESGAFFEELIPGNPVKVMSKFTKMTVFENRITFSDDSDDMGSAYLAVAALKALKINKVDVVGSEDFLNNIKESISNSCFSINIECRGRSLQIK